MSLNKANRHIAEVYMLCGLPGSGKTTYATKLMTRRAFVKLSIDEAMYDRYGRYGVDYPHTQYKDLEKGVYRELDQRMLALLENGESLILDYGLWLKEDRDKYKTILGSIGITPLLLYFKRDRETLRERIKKRNLLDNPNALHVDNELFERMHEKFEEPKDEGEIIIP